MLAQKDRAPEYFQWKKFRLGTQLGILIGLKVEFLLGSRGIIAPLKVRGRAVFAARLPLVRFSCAEGIRNLRIPCWLV